MESVVIPVIISVFTLYSYECYTVRQAKAAVVAAAARCCCMLKPLLRSVLFLIESLVIPVTSVVLKSLSLERSTVIYYV